MGTRFTRVTVVADGRQIDISLPADAPLVEQVPTVLRLLSVPVGPAPVRWRLAAPEFGALDPARSLDQAGVLDGTVLHLTEAAAAPLSPFVDDVEAAVAELVADHAPAWTGPARTDVIGRLLALLLVVTLVVAMYSPAPVNWLGLLLVGIAALVIGRSVTGRGGWAGAMVAVPAAAALVLAVLAAWPSLLGSAVSPGPSGTTSGGSDRVRAVLPAQVGLVLDWHGLTLAVLAGAALALAAVGAVRRSPGLVTGSLLLSVVAAAAVICLRLGLPADRTAGLALVVAVVLSGLAGQLALGGAGLVGLMVADERGEPVPRQRVVSAVRRGLSLATGMVLAAAAIGAAACWVLITGQRTGTAPGWQAPAVGLLGGLIFGLRSRMFSRAHQVGTMLTVVVIAAAAAAVTAPRWLGLQPPTGPWVSIAALGVLGIVVVVSGLRSLREVAGARVQRTLERLELLAVLALVPGLVLLFEVIPMVQRWWS